jgi:hypothetical protein
MIKMLKKIVIKPEHTAQTGNNLDLESDQQRDDDLQFSHIINQFQNCSDIDHLHIEHLGMEIFYFCHLVDKQQLQAFINDIRHKDPSQLSVIAFHSELRAIKNNKDGVNEVLNGNALFSFNHQVFYLPVSSGEARAIQESETESIILGPHEAFVEAASINQSLIRKKVKSAHLKSICLSAGEITKTTITVMYLEDIAPQAELTELIKRIEAIETHGILDTNMLVQMIDEHPYSPFPQFLTTERPDVIASKLLAGKIIGIVDESPYVFCAPVSFFDFFQSVDDYSQRWITGTFIRLLRFFALAITISFTAIYVSVTTFHYEMIPQPLLPSLIQSRSKVPFPPLIEALFLELVIELLREAGARLPTKIGQTIGIVGGIVIGQAAVEAGITSNILIIAVAVSAIASFVIPNYTMSASIRIVRFSFILLAGFWGNIGLIFGLGVLIVHLSTLTTLKTPYLIPISPTFLTDWLDTIIRAPYQLIKERPTQVNTKNREYNKMKK